MKSRLCLVLFALTVVLVAGCVSSSMRGDALTYGQGQLRTTKLPKFSVGRTGTHVFAVSGLSEAIYPYKVRFFTRASASAYFYHTPFEDARLRVEVLDDGSGRVLASTTFSGRRWRHEGEAGVGTEQFDVHFWGRGQPSLDQRERYRVRVTVLEPSDRRQDVARIFLR